MKVEVNRERCKECGLCIHHCPKDAIRFTPGGRSVIDESKCIKCGACWGCCPFGAIREE